MEGIRPARTGDPRWGVKPGESEPARMLVWVLLLVGGVLAVGLVGVGMVLGYVLWGVR